MKATIIHGPRDIRLEDVPDASLRRPTDAVVRVTASCVCGSDLWPYRGVTETRRPSRIDSTTNLSAEPGWAGRTK